MLLTMSDLADMCDEATPRESLRATDDAGQPGRSCRPTRIG